jgi:hypothetical protein
VRRQRQIVLWWRPAISTSSWSRKAEEGSAASAGFGCRGLWTKRSTRRSSVAGAVSKDSVFDRGTLLFEAGKLWTSLHCSGSMCANIGREADEGKFAGPAAGRSCPAPGTGSAAKWHFRFFLFRQEAGRIGIPGGGMFLSSIAHPAIDITVALIVVIARSEK